MFDPDKPPSIELLADRDARDERQHQRIQALSRPVGVVRSMTESAEAMQEACARSAKSSTSRTESPKSTVSRAATRTVADPADRDGTVEIRAGAIINFPHPLLQQGWSSPTRRGSTPSAPSLN